MWLTGSYRGIPAAAGAEACRLNRSTGDGEPDGTGCLAKCCTDANGGIFCDGVAGAADQEHRPVVLARPRASDEGVHPFQFVREAVVHQELQRAVGDGRMRRLPFCRKPGQHVISTERTVFFQKNFQHTAAYGR